MTTTEPSIFDVVMRERKWLIDNPHFQERPASMAEFICSKYLNIERHVRPALREVLMDLFGEYPSSEKISRYQRAIFTGAIGVGKTTLASIVLPYMAHWVLCLKNPQEFYGLMPGTRIAFMQMSTSSTQAKEVVFGDIKARIDNSLWFKSNYPRDDRFKNQIRFGKEIWILPGDSAETTFEGYNILGGILDEIDSHKKTKVKDYAEQGYTTIHSRITSRFQDRGFILLIGQMKSASGFAMKMYKDMKADSGAYTCRMKIWESVGWDKFLNADGTRHSFWYDTSRYQFTTKAYAELMGYPQTIIEVPEVYRRDFMNSPMKALRDLCGLPPTVGAPFIHDGDKILAAREAWVSRNGPVGPVSCVRAGVRDEIAPWFIAPNTLKRVVHVDLAYAAEGDALGLAMGHVPKLVTIDGENKPFIEIDLLLRIKANTGQEIVLGDVRKIIYFLRDDRKFRIKKVTLDGFQSTDFIQQLNKKRFLTDRVSVDKDMLPYQDLYDTLMEERLALPPYITYIHMNEPEPVDILFKELTELEETGTKIDHPPEGSKDLADAVAGVIFTLMGNRSYQTGRKSIDNSGDTGNSPGSSASLPVTAARFHHPAINEDFKALAPVSTPLGDLIPWNPPRR